MPEAGFLVKKNAHRTRRGGLPLQVAREIAQRILTGTYPPEQTIPVESVLVEEFGVSRSALREAIKLLTAKGLLATRPKLGTQVRPEAQWSHLDPDLLAWRAELGVEEEFARHLAEVRQLFESEAAALAAVRASPAQRQLILEAVVDMEQAGSLDQQVAADLAFHRHILEAAGNPLLLSLGGAVWGALAQSFAAGVKDKDAWTGALDRHRHVAKAIAAGEPEAARSAMLEIITRHVDEVGSSRTPREREKR
ncbi:MAG TPA: FadR/GntR family transcriptional regulator [Kiloniellales bacterium]|nr:FadR/GntR family transcriptional regulator [Kiloniellales bacterium]